MIQNRWHAMLARAAMKQNDLADAVSVNKGVMSMICNGTRILPIEKVAECARALHCSVADIYDADTLRVLYGIAPIESEDKQPEKRPVRVTIEPTLADAIDDMVAASVYSSRYEAVNALLRPACRSYRDGGST